MNAIDLLEILQGSPVWGKLNYQGKVSALRELRDFYEPSPLAVEGGEWFGF